MSNFCVLVRTYYWDDELAARFQPLADSLGARFLVGADEKRGVVDVGGHAKVSLTPERVEAMGLVATGDYGWRCGDYVFYAARQDFPDFDYYWLLEDDVLVHFKDPARFFERMASRPTDMLAPFMSPASHQWAWLKRMANFAEPVMSCAFPVVRLSGRAIDALYAKRQEFAKRFIAAGEPGANWPNDESFTATMVAQQGFDYADLRKIRRDVFGHQGQKPRPIDVNDPRFKTYTAKIYHSVVGGKHLASKLNKFIRKAGHFEPEIPRIEALLESLKTQVSADVYDTTERIFKGRLARFEGDTLRKEGNLEGAAEAFRQAMQHDPDWEYHQPLMSILNKLGRSAEAIAVGDDVMARGVDQAAVHFHYGVAARTEGDLNTARDKFETVVALAPWSPQYWKQYLILLRTLGDLDAYEAAFEKAIAHHPDFAHDPAVQRPSVKMFGRVLNTSQVSRRIILCATQRCGSTMVMEDMRNTGVLGKPEEFFINWRKGADIKLAVRLAKLYDIGSTPNGVFAAKIMADQLANAEALLRTKMFERFAADGSFPYVKHLFEGAVFVRIRRKNIVRQAISRVMARQTGINHATGDAADKHFAGNLMKGYRSDYNDKVRYDGPAIHATIEDIEAENARWDQFFTSLDTAPVTIVYEDYVADSLGGLAAIADAAGVTLDAAPGARKMVKLSNARNEDWYTRYIADYGAPLSRD